MNPTISFRVSVPDPHNHLLEVELNLQELEENSELVLRMPVWTPGSYLIREYPRQVQQLKVRDTTGRRREASKIDKASWCIDASGCQELSLTYKVYAFETSPRHNHVDDTHAFFNCVATCMYPEGRLDEPVSLEVVAPDEWEVFCGLAAVDDKNHRFLASDFDELFDTPVEMGPHRYFDFEVRGVSHRFVVWEDALDVDFEALKRDLPEIVEQNASMFGSIPYERYVFINHVLKDSWGGLEHRHSSVNIFGPDTFVDTDRDEDGEFDEDYANVLRLLSHEHFHAYHVKRLRPQELGPFDYQRENYTHSLWAVEGVTSYFDTYQLLQAGIVGPARYMELLEDRIEGLLEVPGRLVHCLEEASFDAWIGLYRRDENTKNSTVSYYLKGELVVWLLDLWIRDQSDGAMTMADVMRHLWDEYFVQRGVGFPREGVEEAVAAVAGTSAADVFDHLVRRAEEIRWEEFLDPVGLALRPSEDDEQGWLGLETKGGDGAPVEIKFVATDSPAQKAGLYAGDEIVAIDGWSVRGKDIDTLIGQRQPGEEMVFDIFRRKKLRTIEATCAKVPPTDYALEPVEDATKRQQRLLQGWLGATEWETA